MRIFENNAEMILLYLYENENSFQKKIAQGIGINRAVVSKNLLELTRKELVAQKSSSVEGFKRKMKVYSLTNNGKKI